MAKMSSGKSSQGKQMGGGTRFPSGGYTIRNSSSAKASTAQLGALKSAPSARMGSVKMVGGGK